MQTGLLKIDILSLSETNIVQDSGGQSGGRQLQVVGRETSCDVTTIDELKSNIMALSGRTVPVVFQYKNSYDGYYFVTDVSVEVDKWFDNSTLVAWSCTLAYLGPDNAVDMESRLTTIVRLNNFSLTGERWHAPAIGHYGYFLGQVAPSTITRTGEQGAIIVYRGIPANVNPRWGAPVSAYLNGRSMLKTNTYTVDRIGARIQLPITGWELNNGLVRVRPAASAGTTLAIAAWTGGAWQEKNWDIRVAGVTLAHTVHILAVTTIRTDPEVTIIRITAKHPTDSTRVLLDLTLRRGARIVEGYMQRATSGNLDVLLDVAEPFTDNSASGYVIATSADAAGNKFVAGSAKTFTPHASGGVSKASTTTLDFWLGTEISGAVAGDQATNLRDQYIGVTSENTVVIPR